MVCCCSMAGTKACMQCSRNPHGFTVPITYQPYQITKVISEPVDYDKLSDMIATKIKQKEKKTMKLFLILVFAVTALMVIPVTPCYAEDGIHASALIGTYFNADVDNFDGTDELNITRDKADWYGSIKVSYDIGKFSPFVIYEERRTVFNETQVGVDYAITPNIGVRGAWVKTDIEGVNTTAQGFAGLKLTY